MWRLTLILSILVIAGMSMLVSTVVFDWFISGSLIVIAFVKSVANWVVAVLAKIWTWFLIGLKSLRWYDIFWFVLIPRFKRFWLFDLPFRLISKYILPYVTMDIKTRKLIQRRMGLFSNLLKSYFTRTMDSWVRVTTPIFGRHTRIALGVLSVIVIALLVYLVYGAYLLIGLVPIPRPIIGALQAIWRFCLGLVGAVIQWAKQSLFRLAMLIGLAGMWTKLESKLMTEERQRVLRMRKWQIARNIIRRRKIAHGYLKRHSLWQRVAVSWYMFMDWLFGRIETAHQAHRQLVSGFLLPCGTPDLRTPLTTCCPTKTALAPT